MKAIVRKELADYFTSIRILVFFGLFFLFSAGALYLDWQGIRGAGSEGFVFLRLYTTGGLFSLVNSLALFVIPLTGISLGFDAINSERTNGTLSHLISQPIYRDSVINGKFIAAVFTLAVAIGTSLLLVAGYGIRMTGVPPESEEVIRMIIFGGLAVVYGAFWISLGILFSVVFRRVAASLLFSVGLWLFFIVFALIIAPLVAFSIAPPLQDDLASLLRNAQLHQLLLRFAPNTLFVEASQVLLQPVLVFTDIGMVGALSSGQAQYMLASPLSMGQSLNIIWPHLTTLISLSTICFAISYVLFMRQEIRST